MLRIIQTIWVVYNKFKSCKRVKELISPENQLTVFIWFINDCDGEQVKSEDTESTWKVIKRNLAGRRRSIHLLTIQLELSLKL